MRTFINYTLHQIKEDGRRGACSTNWRDAQNILVRKSEGKRPLGRPRSKWEDSIRIPTEGISTLT
jgi:hypothetical protein